MGDASSDDSDSMAQTLLEIDYDTVVDDEDVVDEFCTFRGTLEGNQFSMMVCIQVEYIFTPKAHAHNRPLSVMM